MSVVKYQIKNIIFDLGGVIMNLNVHKTIKAFQGLGIYNIVNETGHNYTNQVFYDFETGKISESDFLSELIKLSNQKLSPAKVMTAWNAMILDMPKERIDFLLQLKNEYRIFLLSNTNCIHQHKFLEEFKNRYGFNFNTLFEKAYYSHEIGLRKPNIEAFQFVLKDGNLNPKKTLFADDSTQNINSAQKAGIQTYYIENYNLLGLVENLNLRRNRHYWDL